MTCDAKIRPFPNDTEIACEDHEEGHHRGVLRDYAFPGSETIITWQESDRRNFHGTWPGKCSTGCSLPRTHRGRCAE